MKPVVNISSTCIFYGRFPGELFCTGCVSPAGIMHYNFITISSRDNRTYAPIGNGKPICNFENICPYRE